MICDLMAAMEKGEPMQRLDYIPANYKRIKVVGSFTELFNALARASVKVFEMGNKGYVTADAVELRR